MSTILPSEITADIAKNINRFGKNIQLRVKLWKNDTNQLYDTDPVGTGDYNTSTGEYSLGERKWIKSIFFTGINPGDDSYAVFYVDDNGNMILAKTSTTTSVVLEYPVYASTFYLLTYLSTDEVPTYTAPSLVYLMLDVFTDVTKYSGDQVTIIDKVDRFSGEVHLPHIKLSLNNQDNFWNRNTSIGITSHSEQVDGIFDMLDTIANYKQNTDARCTIEINFSGENWQMEDWILIANFVVRNWAGKVIEGESAWNAKTKISTPLVEGGMFQDVIEDYIIRDGGELILQFNRPAEEEIITVTDELVGYAEIEPVVPDVLLGTEYIWSHCQDDTHIFYAIRNTAGATGQSGVFFRIYKVLIGGGDSEFIGDIYCIPAKYYYYNPDSAVYDFEGYFPDSDSTIYNGNTCTRYMREICPMDVDDEYLYIPIVATLKVRYGNTGLGKTINIPYAESAIYKLRKDGVGWGSVCGSSYQQNQTLDHNNVSVNHILTPYVLSFADGMKKRSWGYYIPIASSSFADPNDADALTFEELYTCVNLYNHNGTMKLLVMKRVIGWSGSSGTNTEAYLIPLDLSSESYVSYFSSAIFVQSIVSYDEDTMFVHYWEIGDTHKMSVLMGDVDTTVDQDDEVASVITPGRSMSIIGGSIYIAGQTYDFFGETVGLGINELYRCAFQLSGYNIVHVGGDRDRFLSYPIPIVRVGGDSVSDRIVRYDTDRAVGETYSNAGFTLDLKTGLLIIKEMPPSPGEEFPVTASYDFVNSFQFFKAEAASRLGAGALSDISAAQKRSYRINEAGVLSELNFVKSQVIPIRGVDIDYYKILEDYDEGKNSPLSDDFYEFSTLFEFTPDFDGKFVEWRIPIRLYSPYTVPIEDTPIDVDIGIVPDIDCSDVGGDGFIDTPPNMGSAVLLASSQVYISQAKTVGNPSLNYSWFYWFSFDVSAADYALEAGRTYGIILRFDTRTGHSLNKYQAFTKVIDSTPSAPQDMSLNRLGHQFASSGTGWPPPGGSWQTLAQPTEWSMAGLHEVIIKKTKQELDNVDGIIDDVNPDITNSFESIAGGTDSTVIVRDLDSGSKFPTVAFAISYSGGKYYFEPNESYFGIDNVLLVSWIEAIGDLIKIDDSVSKVKNMLSETEQYGDSMLYLSSEVIGRKLSISDVAAIVNKRYEILPGSDLDLEENSDQIKNIKAVTIEEWNDLENKFEEVDRGLESEKFALTLSDPFIVGTTAYNIKYGKGLNSDNVQSGNWGSSIDHEVPIFYKFAIPTPYASVDYHIMLRNDLYKSWRVATEQDRNDMEDHTVDTATGNSYPIGGGPIPDTLIKDTGHFFLKFMNNRYGLRTVYWFTYESEERRFFINRDGVVIEDTAFSATDPRNPAPSGYPSKTMNVVITPMDYAGNPLFEFHHDSGVDGYSASYHADINRNMSTRINRAELHSRGVNLKFSNFGSIKQFLEMNLLGYPVNTMTNIKSVRRNPGYNHADAKVIRVDTDLIQSRHVSDRKAAENLYIWGEERSIYSRALNYDPRLRPGITLIINSPEMGFDNYLFHVFDAQHNLTLNPGGAISTNLPSMLQL